MPKEFDLFTTSGIPKVNFSELVLGKQSDPESFFITRANGNAMDRSIPNGALLIVKRVSDWQELQDGVIVVFQNCEKMTIKRYYYDDQTKIRCFSPDSADANFKPHCYRQEDLKYVRIIGQRVSYIQNS
ncbi:S24 family peptidase [Lactobacillus sp. DCY120]|uniref:S24 family peptidase n=1 Tax=Bombilactobacillus apium TaxID=2675299 RepID=A0A850QYQ1_9LACO|nr:S24 family peptidase [Bombilactobacillus apium]NVY95859.1 S24 family peptidase [Bombilactobacillus apium]